MDENLNSRSKSPEEVQSSTLVDSRLKKGSAINSSILRYFQILIINKWLFLSVLLFVASVSVFYALRQPKLYESEYEIFYNESIREFIAGSDVSTIKSDFDKNFWLSTMRSDGIVRLTTNYLGLSYKTEDLKPMLKVEIIDKKKEDRIPVYKISITTPDCLLNSKIMIAYVKALNELLLKNQANNSEKLVAYLRNQLIDNNNKLSEIDNQILNYGSRNPEQLINISRVSSNLESFHTDLLNTRIELSSIKASRQRTELELKTLDGTIVDESSFSEPLKVQLMNLEVDLARALTKSREDHPSIKAIRNNIRQINVMLRDSLDQRLEIKSLMQNPVKSQLMSKLSELKISEIAEESRLKSLEKVISELGQKMLPNSIDENLQQSLRNREMIFMTIKQLNSKLIEAECSAQGSLSRFVVIDEPLQSLPTNKNIFFYIITGLIIGILLAGCVVYVYDMLDNRLMLVSDYESFYNLPLLAVTTHYTRKDDFWTKNNESTPDNNEKFISELGNLVLNIRNVVRKTEKKLFAVYSPIRREGKSLVSFQTSLNLAEKKMKVLLVDIDFFSPKLTRVFDKKDQKGLTDYLSGNCNVSDIIYSTEHENLSFTGVGTLKIQDLSYDDPLLSDFIEYVRSQYDVIIFDTPALLYIPDIVNFMDKIENVIVIVRLGYTTRNSLDRLLKILHIYQSKIIGVVLNDLKINMIDRYSDYYHYDYYTQEGQNKDDEQHSDSGNTSRIKRLVHNKWVWAIIIIILIACGITYTLKKNSLQKEVNEVELLMPKDTLNTVKDKGINTLVSRDTLVPQEIEKVKPAVNLNSEYLDSMRIDSGLRLTLISLQYYGHKQFWVYIYLANKERFPNPNNIPVGSKIYIPRPEKYGIDKDSKKSLDEAAALQMKIINKNL